MIPVIVALSPFVRPIVRALAKRLRARITSRRRGKPSKGIVVAREEIKELLKAAVGNAYSRTTGEFDEKAFMAQQARSEDYPPPAQIIQNFGTAEALDTMKKDLLDLLRQEIKPLVKFVEDHTKQKIKELK